MFPGFADRLHVELDGLSGGMKARVWSPKDELIQTWVGGSILASLSTFKDKWVTKAEYEEHGVDMVRKRCF